MGNGEVRIVFLSDLHYALQANLLCPKRKGEYSPSLLAGLVKKINWEIKPDLVLCGGDIINFPEAEEAGRLTEIMADILALCNMPCVVVRGNHDIVRDDFNRYFPFSEITDAGFVRIVAFDDEECPGYNARRSQSDIQRMIQAAENFDGVLFSFQHVPLLPEGRCVFGYENAGEIFEVMRRNNYRGTLSGHYHRGIELFTDESLQFFVQSALCEEPFSASLLTIDRHGIADVRTIE